MATHGEQHNYYGSCIMGLHVECGGSFDQLSFRRYIVRVLIQSANQRTTGQDQYMAQIRTDGIGHHLITADKQRRSKICKKNARLMQRVQRSAASTVNRVFIHRYQLMIEQ